MPEFIVDGQTYETEVLTDQSRSLMTALRFAEQEIADINRRVGMVQTARNTYMQALNRLLPSPIDEGQAAKEAVLTVNDRQYLRASLSGEANAQLQAVLEADKLLKHLEEDYVIAEMARKVYGQEFKMALSA